PTVPGAADTGSPPHGWDRRGYVPPMDDKELVRSLLDRHGRTYAEEAGIRLRDTPSPLYQVLVLSVLLSARIRAGVAVASARALFDAGLTTPRRMADARWQQ